MSSRSPLLMLPVALAAFAAFGAVVPSISLHRPEPPPLAGGIQITEDDLDYYAASVVAAGLNSIQVTVYARQGAWNTADFTWKDEDGASVAAEIRAAHDAGLDVVLILRTYLEHGLPANRHLWHGMIWPPDDQLDAWFDTYTDFARWGGELARDEGVEVLVIGNELNSMTSTRPLTELPDPYAYFLDPARTASVREDLLDCARRVPGHQLRPDLEWLDGTTYDDLSDAMLSEEQTRRAWAREITGGTSPDDVDLAALNRRRARLETHWRSVIDATRQVYSGTVVYGANFDQFGHVGFWDAVDAVGVTSYFPLSLWGARGDVQRAQLRDGWRRVAAGLTEVATEAGTSDDPKPVYLLELGWTRRAGSTVRPWSYDRVEVLETIGAVPEGGYPELSCVHWASQPEDAGERERALEALAEIVRAGEFDVLRGFSLWKITTRAQHREEEPFAIVLAPPAEPGAPSAKTDSDEEMLRGAAELGRLLSRDLHFAPTR